MANLTTKGDIILNALNVERIEKSMIRRIIPEPLNYSDTFETKLTNIFVNSLACFYWVF